MDVCTVCQGEAAGGMNRVGGADVCDACYLGMAPQRVASRGWGFRIAQWERTDQDGDTVAYVTDSTLSLPHAHKVEFMARRKTLVWRLLALASPGVRSGDAMFDRFVYTSSKTPGPTSHLVRDEGVQSILMDMMGEGSWVSMDGQHLRVFSVRDEYIPEARFSSEMCVLASHIERLAI